MNEEEIRDEIKRRKKLRQRKEEREQLVRQIADEEGLPPENCDFETSDTQGPIRVKEKLLNDDQTYTRKIERGRTTCNILEQGSAREDSLSRKTTGNRPTFTERICQCVI